MGWLARQQGDEASPRRGERFAHELVARALIFLALLLWIGWLTQRGQLSGLVLALSFVLIGLFVALLWLIPAMLSGLRWLLEKSRRARAGFAWGVKWGALVFAVAVAVGPILGLWTMDWPTWLLVAGTATWPLVLWSALRDEPETVSRLASAWRSRPGRYLED